MYKSLNGPLSMKCDDREKHRMTYTHIKYRIKNNVEYRHSRITYALISDAERSERLFGADT